MDSIPSDTPSTLQLPSGRDLVVVIFDYVINKKWSAFMTYHYADTARVGTEQFSVADTSAPGSVAQDPIKAVFYTFEFVGRLSPTLTWVTHGSFLRDWWGWSREAPSPLVSGTTAALEMAGEGTGTSNSTTKLFADPVLLATSNARSRVFDGHKWYLAQDFSWVKGSHLFQFGGSGYISHDYFLKTDNFAGGLTTGPINYIESTGNGSGEVVTVGSTQTGDLRWRPNDKLFDVGKFASLQRTLLHGFGIWLTEVRKS